MSEETNVDAGMMMTGMEQRKGKWDQQKMENLLILLKKLIIDEEIQGEQEIDRVGSSPGGSFPSLSSSQSSGSNKMIPYVSPIGKVRVLKFEDTLSEEDHRGFNIIYESLLLEGRMGNLTDLTMGIVLAGKNPTWLQVMHERLKHLIISLETFKKKKRAEHIAQARGKNIRKERDMEKVNLGQPPHNISQQDVNWLLTQQ